MTPSPATACTFRRRATVRDRATGCWTVALAAVAGTGGAVQISANSAQPGVRTPDNTSWDWGSNLTGGLGDATTIDRAHAVRVRRSY